MGRDGQAGAEEEDEEEDDYIDSDDEREEGEKIPHENAFVYIDSSGKLVYVEPDEPDQLPEETGGIGDGSRGQEDKEGEEKEEEKAKDSGEGVQEEQKMNPLEETRQGGELQPQQRNDKDRHLTKGSEVSCGVERGCSGAAGDREAKGNDGDGAAEEEASPCPLPRINPCLTVRGNTLFVYGGILEVCARCDGHRVLVALEITWVSTSAVLARHVSRRCGACDVDSFGVHLVMVGFMLGT